MRQADLPPSGQRVRVCKRKRELPAKRLTFNHTPAHRHSVRPLVAETRAGGIRRGIDIFKALALGAKAVLVGRPIWYGLAAGGEQGVQEVFRILQREYLAPACSPRPLSSPDWRAPRR